MGHGTAFWDLSEERIQSGALKGDLSRPKHFERGMDRGSVAALAWEAKGDPAGLCNGKSNAICFIS